MQTSEKCWLPILVGPQWMRCCAIFIAALSIATIGHLSTSFGQSVGLPAPRLSTTTPMGAKVGTEVDVAITGDNIEEADQLFFSDPRITATRKLDAAGLPESNHYRVRVAEDCPLGIYEARVMTRLGISSSRVFSVGGLPEVVQKAPNTSITNAMELNIPSVCNGTMKAKSIDHYSFKGRKGGRYIIHCASKGIDSKLEGVLILADSLGKDLTVERRGGILDFTAPEDAQYMIKIHELTFRGGPDFFYRLSLQEIPLDAPLPSFVSTRSVSSFSWPPIGLAEKAALQEVEPNNSLADVQKITLPCDIEGHFFPAADVDRFEFAAKKGEVWWIELASERLGFPTDASILVQQVQGEGAERKYIDVAELGDIPSPVKVSSNGYAYDGPPYDAGSPDAMGKIEIKEDGNYSIQVADLFGGTRNDPRNAYRLVVRKGSPDFALVAWPLHMELRNGDRNALSKPLALRGGATMALEVVAVRRDGFDGEIELVMEGLPEGVHARGLKIPSGKSRGIMLVSADQTAPRTSVNIQFFGRSTIEGAKVRRPCRMAELKWSIPDSWSDIPEPRLVADVPVSVSGLELAPLSIAAEEKKIFEVQQGQKLTIPLRQTRRTEFSGATLALKTMGDGFDRTPQFDVSLTADQSQAVLDLATLKTPPGDYQIAFYGGAVSKYRYLPELIAVAEIAQKKAEQELKLVDEEHKGIVEESKTSTAERKSELDRKLESSSMKQKQATMALAAANERLKAATQKAAPKDIVDLVVSEPIDIRVLPLEKK